MVMSLLHSRISIVTIPNHDVLLNMRFGLARHLPLKRSFPSYSIIFGSKSHVTVTTTTTTESENLVNNSTEETIKEKDNKKEEVSLPQPPEKPEPGDCCGNGCVRCVWDIYYEELEDYKNTISGEKNK